MSPHDDDEVGAGRSERWWRWGQRMAVVVSLAERGEVSKEDDE